MKEEVRVALIAAALLAAGFSFWLLDELADCRDHGDKAFRAALLSGCNKTGIYGPDRIARPFGKPPGLIPSRTAYQQNRR